MENEKFDFIDRVKTATSGTYYLSIPHELREIVPIGTLVKVSITKIREPEKKEGGE